MTESIHMVDRSERVAWTVVFAVVLALAVPWFMWRSDTVVAGLPLWLWWHVGWLCLTSVTFYVFTQRAWGIWVGGEAA